MKIISLFILLEAFVTSFPLFSSTSTHALPCVGRSPLVACLSLTFFQQAKAFLLT